MDLITGLPQTRTGHTAIAVFVDRMSKMAHFVATHTTVSAAEISRLFLDNIFKLHGMPEEIVSDRHPRFTSTFWSELMAMLGAKRSMSSAYHPQSDGQTERMNRVLEDMLRHYCDPSQTDWDEHLSLAEFAVNIAVQASTRFTPFMLNSGQHPRTPTTIAELRDAYPNGRRKNPAAEQKFVEMQQRLKAARENLNGAQQRQKAFADEVRRTHSFTIGQRVLLSTVHLSRRSPGTAKLLPKWIGPFTISERIGEVAFRLILLASMKIHDVFHASLLKTWHESNKRQPPPATLFIDGSVEYEVERILDHAERHENGAEGSDRTQRKRGKSKVLRDFLVKWRDYGPEHNTWEPESNIPNCGEILQEYWESQRA